MASAKISLLGFEQYLNMSGHSLFEALELPDGIDKDLLCNNILITGGEFESLYADPNFLQFAIAAWGKKWERTFIKWVEALGLEYNPLHNYDRHEEWEDKGNMGRNRNRSADIIGEDLRTDDLTQTNDLTQENNLTQTNDLSQDTDGTVTNTRSAFDVSTYQPHDQSTTDETVTNTGTVENTGTITNTGTVENTGTVRNERTEGQTENESESGTSSGTHTGHLYGNIGVTTSQQMLRDELDVSQWNLYEHITDIFLREFTIPVYE